MECIFAGNLRKYHLLNSLMLSFVCLSAHADEWTEVSGVLDSIKPVVNANMALTSEYGRDGMLLGNGDMGVAAVSSSTQIEYALSSNEFPGRIGRVLVQRNGGSGASAGTPRHEQNMKHGELLFDARISSTYLETEAYVPYLVSGHKNILVVKITNRDAASVPLKFLLENYGAPSPGSAEAGVTDNVAWATREMGDSAAVKTPNWRAGFSASLIGAATEISSVRNSSAQSQLSCELAPGATLEFIVNLEVESGLSDLMPPVNDLRDSAIAKSDSLTTTSVWRSAHLAWWQDYWTKSYAVLDDTVAKSYYYGALYNMGTSYRAGFAPPGLSGLWIYSDDAAFGNSYYLNYNFNSGFYGFASSNRLESFNAYSEPLFQAYSNRRYVTNTRAKFPGWTVGRYQFPSRGGNYYDQASMAHVGEQNTAAWDLAIDYSDAFRSYQELDQQKSLSAYYANVIINAYLHSEDMSILDYSCPHLYGAPNQTEKDVSVYEILLLMAEFYVSYIKTECKEDLGGGRYEYHIYDSWAREPEPGEAGVKVDVKPANGTGDVDANFDLGAVRFFLRGMIKITSDRGADLSLQANWKDILDNLADYPTTGNDGIPSNDTTSVGTSVLKECQNRPELNYLSQGRDTLCSTMAYHMYPGDEGRENGTDGAQLVASFIEQSVQSVRTPSSDLVPAGTPPQHIVDMFPVINDWNNFAHLIPMLVRGFYDGTQILELLDYQMHQSGLHNGMSFNQMNLLKTNGPEANSVVDAINDMLVMGHLSESSGAGTLGKSGAGSDDKAGGRYIKLFPVWPSNKSAKFHQIRTRGAFLVSAEQDNTGTVLSCQIQSEKGNACRIVNPWNGQNMTALEGSNPIGVWWDGDICNFNTEAGKTYTLQTGTANPSAVAAVLEPNVTSGIAPLTVKFSVSNSVGNINAFSLDVDSDQIEDSKSSTTFQHTYNVPGVYAVTLDVSNAANRDSATQQIVVAEPPVVDYPSGNGSGQADRYIWTNLSGDQVSHLTAVAGYPASYNVSSQVTSLNYDATEISGLGITGSYATRTVGLFSAPVTDDYIFQVSADDSIEFWISTDRDPANKVKVVESTSYMTATDWKSATQPVSLIAGQEYYFEVLHKEGSGGDFRKVAMSGQYYNLKIIDESYVSRWFQDFKK